MGILALLQRCNISGALVSQQAGPREQHLWDVLDEATYQTIAALASRGSGATPDIDYWIEGGAPEQGFWQARRPGK